MPIPSRTRETEGTPSISYDAGGVAYLASQIGILRSEWGTRLLWLDAGDEFQGTIESNSQQGAPMVEFFNLEGLDAAAIGNHEFDFGPEPGTQGPGADPLGTLKLRLKEAKYPYLAANISDASSGKLAELPNVFPSRMLRAGNLNVGVIGLSTTETPKTTRATNVQGLRFTSLQDAVLREAASLRSAGAAIVVIDAHVGLKCEPGASPTGHSMRKSADPQGDCGSQDEMVKLLKDLPPGTVDAVVAGHSHQIVHHWIAGGTRDRRRRLGPFLQCDLPDLRLEPEKTRHGQNPHRRAHSGLPDVFQKPT